MSTKKRKENRKERAYKAGQQFGNSTMRLLHNHLKTLGENTDTDEKAKLFGIFSQGFKKGLTSMGKEALLNVLLMEDNSYEPKEK